MGCALSGPTISGGPDASCDRRRNDRITAKHKEDGSATGTWTNIVQVWRNGSFSHAITTNAAFRQALKEITTNDQVQLVFEETDGKRVEVLVTNLGGRDLQRALLSYYSVITGALDGTLGAAVSQIGNTIVRERTMLFLNELQSDLEAAAAGGRFILMEGNRDLAQFESGRYTGRHLETVDLNGDGQLTIYHRIFIDPDEVGFERNDPMSVRLVHELFHLLEGEKSLDIDYERFGTTEAGHQGPYDRAAAELIALGEKSGSGINLEGNSLSGSVQGANGSAGVDHIQMGSGFRGLFATALAGDDVLTAPFSSSVLDGGAGNDSFFVTGGIGRVVIFDESGTDTLDFGNGFTRQHLVVRANEGWVEIALNSTNTQNVTPSDLNSWVFIAPNADGVRAIDLIRIGGETLTLDQLLTTSNSRPFIVSDLSFIRAPGQYNPPIVGYDLDGDALTFSVVSVTGYASRSVWSIYGGELTVSAQQPFYNSYSNVTIRVSDGKLYSDWVASVYWQAAGEQPSWAPLPTDDGLSARFTSIDADAFAMDDIALLEAFIVPSTEFSQMMSTL